MLREKYIQIGDKNFKITKELCEEKLGGKWLNLLGCIVNSRFKYVAKGNQIFVTPMRAKKLPVLVQREDFMNITGRGGRLSDVHTYLLG
jgi:hypothetical protein